MIFISLILHGVAIAAVSLDGYASAPFYSTTLVVCAAMLAIAGGICLLMDICGFKVTWEPGSSSPSSKPKESSKEQPQSVRKRYDFGLRGPDDDTVRKTPKYSQSGSRDIPDYGTERNGPHSSGSKQYSQDGKVRGSVFNISYFDDSAAWGKSTSVSVYIYRTWLVWHGQALYGFPLRKLGYLLVKTATGTSCWIRVAVTLYIWISLSGNTHEANPDWPV